MSTIAAEREARRQQRLRGAQRHQIPDVDFGLSFPAFPAASQQSNREVTPPRAEVALSINAIFREIPESPAKQTPQATNETDASVNGSKRKASEITENELEGSGSVKIRRLDGQPPSSSRSNRSRKDIYEFDEDEPPGDSVQGLNALNSEIARAEGLKVISKSPDVNLDIEDEVFEQEIDESPSRAPGSGRQRRLRDGQSTAEEAESLVIEAQQQQASSSAKKRRTGRSRPSPRPESTPEAQRDEIDELDELSPEGISLSTRRPSRRSQGHVSDDDGEEAEEIDDLEAAEYMQKHRQRDVLNDDSLDFDELVVDEFVSGITDTPASNHPDHVESVKKAGRPKRPSKASPSAQRQPKPKVRKSKGVGKGAKKSRGELIPVTVYRLTKAPDYDEDADEADILISSVPYFKRAGVNAVDLLSQVAEELIESGISTLDEALTANADPRAKEVLNIKLRALKHYQQEMGPRLLELSSNLDHGYSLTRRIRIAQRKRVELREDVMRIRSERENIALRMDEIRMKQEEDEKHFLARKEINNAFHDIENAVERGKAMSAADEEDEDDNVVSGDHQTDTAGLKMLLKTVAAEVSSSSDEGGVLKMVKEFNAFLERAAAALEGRL